MAGLLDAFNDPQQVGLLAAAAQMLQASGPSRTPTSFGQVLGGGLLSGIQGMQQAQDRQREVKLFDIKSDLYQQQLDEHKRKAEVENGILSAAKASMVSPEYQSLMGGGGPTVANAEKIGNLAPKFDTQGFVSRVMQVDPLKGIALQQQLAKESAFNKVDPKDYTAESVAKFAQTHNYADLVPRVKLEEVNLGGKVAFRNPYETTLQGEVAKTMTPGEVASNGLGWANYGLSKQRFANEVANHDRPQFVEGLGGFVSRPTTQNPSGSFTPLAGIPASGKATEDERKAAGWLSQANNAWNNMQAVMYDGKGQLKASVVKPGTLETTFSAMGFDEAANNMRGADRQRFMQASSSLSEALLRAATGAGINAFEAQQKVNELTPRMTDKPEVVQQKMQAIPMYLDSLKTRAGRALPANFGTGLPSTANASSVVDFGSLK